STKCRSKHLLLLTSYTSYQKAYCPSLPISSIHAQRHLFFNPLSTRRPSSPGFMNLLSILLSFGDISLLGHLRSIGRAIEKSRCEAHFPKTRPNLLLIG